MYIHVGDIGCSKKSVETEMLETATKKSEIASYKSNAIKT